VDLEVDVGLDLTVVTPPPNPFKKRAKGTALDDSNM
jgi:hypothetical protein